MSDKLKIKIHGYPNTAVLLELIDEFISPEDRMILPDDGFRMDKALHINLSGSTDREEVKREIYRELAEITGEKPDWGILTGVRPVKLAGEMLEASGDEEQVRDTFIDSYYLSPEKADLLLEIYNRQYKLFGKPDKDSVGLYIGIPFCPTRCNYCSFASNQVGEKEIEEYLPAIIREIEYVSRKMKEAGQYPETIYIGGGTPTSLDAGQLERLMDSIIKGFSITGLSEFTCEAGRPDTIDGEKLEVLKDAGVDRISINPQSMKEETLRAIGRAHTTDDVVKAFQLVKERGFVSINSDVIAGLPGENVSDLTHTIEKLITLGANAITVHTLAVKRSSRLHEEDKGYHYKAGDTVKKMLAESSALLRREGFVPYYLYRQKHMAGAGENTGYCLEGRDGLYNIRIMDEHQTIIALGAGGISKRYYPETNRLERVPNVTNYRQYIDRIDEMIKRKETGLWR